MCFLSILLSTRISTRVPISRARRILISQQESSSSSQPDPTPATRGAGHNRKPGRLPQAKRVLKDIIYPHNIHPALVPGVSIEDQKIKYGVDKPILVMVGGLIVAFIIWGVLALSLIHI